MIVWFSSGWSKETLKEFTLACTQLLESEELQSKNEENLVKHWLSNDVTIETVKDNWFAIALRNTFGFSPCGNFKHEIDRLDFAR